MRPTPDFKHGRQLTTVRVLLLEDDQAFAGLVRANLERVDWADLSIEHAPTMRDALARLERGGLDIVITDLNLPDSKGLDTVESLVRATDRLILVLTGERDAGLREAVLEQGAYDIMSKDRIDRIELERLVRLATMQANTFRSLRLSEERFRSLAELSADWYWEQDTELRYISTGGAPEARRGITGDAHVGLRRWDLPGTEILQQTWDEHKAVLAARQPFQDLLLRRIDSQGEARYLNISGRPMFDAHGTFCGYRGAAKDVTRRVQMDMRLAIEHAVTRLLAQSGSIAEATPRIIQAICETLGWACGARWEHDAGRKLLVYAEAWGIASTGIDAFLEVSRERPSPLTQSGGLNRRAWAEGKPIWIRDVTREETFLRAPYAVKAGLHSALAFPIKVGAEVIGVMELFNRGIQQPEAELIECMTNVGSQIGQFMQRKHAEEELRRFRLAMDNSADMIVLIDRKTMLFVDVNETMCRQLGYTREELLRMGPDAVLPSSREELERAYDAFIAEPSNVGGMRSAYHCKDGSLLPFESTRRVLRSGDTYIIAAISRDIRERLTAEEALRESEGRFRSLTGLSSDMYWEQDEQFRFTSQSGTGSEHVGARIFPLVGKKRWEQNYVNMSPDDWARHRALLEAHKPFRDLELCRLSEAGAKVWISISGEPVFDKAGAFKGYRGIGKDISQRKHADELLALEHAVTRCLADAENVSDALKEAMREIGETQNWEVGRCFRPDEKTDVLRLVESWARPDAVLQEFLSTSKDSTFAAGVGLVGTVWQTGQPLWVPDVNKDSRVFLVKARNRAGIRGAFVFPAIAEGRTVGVLSFSSREIRAPDERLLQTVRVIGSQIGQFMQRKQAEEVRRESEERFRSLTGLSSDWYWEQDADYRFTLISNSVKDATGRPAANLGKMRWDQPALNMTEADWAAHRALLDARKPFYNLELHRRTHEGLPTYISISGEPMLDAAGAFKGYRGIGKDITEGKRAEQLVMLEHTVARYLAAADNIPEMLKAAIRAVCETEGWECGRYFRVDESAGLLRFAEAWSVSGELMDRFIEKSRGFSYAPGVGLMGRVWQTGEPIWSADIAQDARIHAGIAREIGMHGSFVFPVLAERKTIGVLIFHSREIRQAEERLLRSISVIGSQIGQFLQRKLAEQVLRESEARFRSLTKLSSDFYWETDAEHRMLQTHHAGQHQPVIRREQRFGKTRWEVPSTYPDAAGWAEHRATLEAHQPFREFEFARVDDSGVERHLSISGEPIFDAEGLFKGYRGVGKDITPRRQAEEHRAIHTRYQEKIARFGASALGKREALELIEDALQAVIEALPMTVVAYVEPGAGTREVVMRGLTGLASGEGAAVAVYGSADHLALPLEHGELAIVDRPAAGVDQPAAGVDRPAAGVDRPASGAALLPFHWAGAFSGAALVPVHGDNRVQGVLCVMSETPGAFGAEESKFLVTAAAVLSAGLRRIHSEGRLAFLAQFDALTGLPNRALLSDRFSQMIVQARRHEKQLGVLFIDLDDFKLVNDSLGHAGGDELLKETARRLQSSVRAGDTVARISGDEFAVILGDLARPDDAALVAQKIIDCLSAPVSVRGHEVFVTASIGIAAFPSDGSDAEALLGAADAAMYRAKQSGRNAYQFFTADINQRTRARAQLGSELRRALERGEFALAYQPKFDLRSGRPCGAEALLRWRHPERGLVPPVEFIPVLEETGLIVQVGEWVLRRACEDLKAWQTAGLPPMQVAVNLSARQFRQQDLDVAIRELVRAAGVAPEMIELEITESQLMQDPDHAKRVIQALSEGGIGVAIDDFGTGYSSLSYLTRFPVSALKIDRSFVAEVLSDRAAAAIVRTIIDMAHTLGFIVIAEGVETEAQALLLRGLGCEQAQGYFFAKPQPEAEFRKLIAAYSRDSARHQIAGER